MESRRIIEYHRVNTGGLDFGDIFPSPWSQLYFLFFLLNPDSIAVSLLLYIPHLSTYCNWWSLIFSFLFDRLVIHYFIQCSYHYYARTEAKFIKDIVKDVQTESHIRLKRKDWLELKETMRRLNHCWKLAQGKFEWLEYGAWVA